LNSVKRRGTVNLCLDVGFLLAVLRRKSTKKKENCLYKTIYMYAILCK
jgi:hypothetical protein